MKCRGKMNILTKTVYAILGAAVYTSSVHAMPFQLDLSSRWGQTASSLKFDFGGIESLQISSIFIDDEVKKNTTTEPDVSHNDTNQSFQYLFADAGTVIDNNQAGKARSGDQISDTGGISGAVLHSGVQAVENNVIAEIDGSVTQFVADDDISFSNLPVDHASTTTAHVHKSAKKTSQQSAGSFKFVIGKQAQDEPDLSSVWLIGLVLGLSGIAWRLASLIRESNDL